jgi:hypothetical protein
MKDEEVLTVELVVTWTVDYAKNTEGRTNGLRNMSRHFHADIIPDGNSLITGRKSNQRGQKKRKNIPSSTHHLINIEIEQ